MAGFRTLTPFQLFKGWQTGLGLIVTCNLVLSILTTMAVASPTDSDCSSAAKRGNLNLFDAKTQHHVRYKRKYDIECIGGRGVDKGLDFYSRKREESLGQQMSNELNANLKFINDPEVNAYVTSLVQKLVMHSDAQVPFTVRVVKDDEINAYALPGGFLYVNTGLILDVPDEATLAGLLAHEIAHVAARHGTKILTKRYLFKMATLPLTFVGGMALSASDIAVPMLMFKFSRDTEREADLLGIEYAYSAGYDPQQFIRFFESLSARSQQKVPFALRMFATHPVSKDRIQRAQLEIETLLPAKAEYVVDSSDFTDMKQRLSTILDRRCEASNGKPILLGPTGHCPDKRDSEQRPKLNTPGVPRPPAAPKYP